MKQIAILVFTAAVACAIEIPEFKTLKGTKTKVEAAHQQALAHDYTFARDSDHLTRFLRQGLLAEMTGNDDYTLYGVSHPYIRPMGKTFVERLSRQYRAATGEKLIVTSMVRTLDGALWNSSSKSVHPTGMAIDFRIPSNAKARAWLEESFLIMQSRGVIIATREKNPPHYHIVVLPRQYRAYVESRSK
jgi:uncharacterized protein YcbK (DUF882 family)